MSKVTVLVCRNRHRKLDRKTMDKIEMVARALCFLSFSLI